MLDPIVLYVPAAPEDLALVDLRAVGSRRSQWVIAVLLLVVFGQAWGLWLTVPRFQAFDVLIAENTSLKDRILALDAQVEQGEAVFTRLRTYDARLKSLTQPRGDHGGPNLPVDDLANHGVTVDDGGEGGDLLTADAVLGEGPIDPEKLSPAEAWALDVSRRMAELVDQYQQVQPDLDLLMSDLESLKTISDALPGIWPTNGEITSGFGWRTDPVHGGTRFHAGLDLANDRGTPIYAVAPGRVIRAETTTGYGRMIDIDHGYGITTRYAHCTTLRVRVGDRVERGDFISTMGSTGKSTGPHLHFELRIDDSPHDPLKYLPRTRR